MRQYEVFYLVNGKENRVPIQADWYEEEFGVVRFYRDKSLTCAFREWIYVMEHAHSRSFHAPHDFTKEKANDVKRKLSAFSSRES